MLLRSLLEKEGFLQAAEMVRDAFRLPNGPSMLTILHDFSQSEFISTISTLLTFRN